MERAKTILDTFLNCYDFIYRYVESNKDSGSIYLDTSVKESIFKRRPKHGYAQVIDVFTDSRGLNFHIIYYNTLTGEYKHLFTPWFYLKHYHIDIDQVLLFTTRCIAQKQGLDLYDCFVDKYDVNFNFLFVYECEVWAKNENEAHYLAINKPIHIIYLAEDKAPISTEENNCSVFCKGKHIFHKLDKQIFLKPTFGDFNKRRKHINF